MTTKKRKDSDRTEDLQLEFHGCIVPLPSDKSKKSAKLTSEQSEALAELLYLSFKRWYGL